MEPLFASLIERLETMHEAIETAITDLPDEALDWSPGPDMNTLAVLLAHTLGAERFWIGDVAGDEPSGRVREAEFRTAGVGESEFTQHSKNVLAHSRSIIERLAIADLGEIRSASAFGRQVTIAYALLHALEHTALHTGHIQVTRQLWDQRQV